MGDDLQTQVVIDKGALPFLFKLLSENYGKDIKWEVCWVISNITAGNRAQIQAVIDADIIGPLVHLLRHAEFDVKKEAAWALSNATSGGSNLQIQQSPGICFLFSSKIYSQNSCKHLVSQWCIEAFCNLLACPDPKIVMVCLQGLDDILNAGEMEKGLDKCGLNRYAQFVDECKGLEKIEHRMRRQLGCSRSIGLEKKMKHRMHKALSNARSLPLSSRTTNLISLLLSVYNQEPAACRVEPLQF